MPLELRPPSLRVRSFELWGVPEPACKNALSPVNVGALERTTLPVPVLVVVPVPPRDNASVPVVIFAALSAVRLVPIPDKIVAVNAPTLAVPCTSRAYSGEDVRIPTFDVVVSTKRFAVPTSILERALNAFVSLRNSIVDEVVLVVAIEIWSRLKLLA